MSVLRWLQQRRLRRAHADICQSLWPAAFGRLALLRGLDAASKGRLKDLAALFLHDKRLELARGAELDPVLGVEIGLCAALPVLHLGLDWYRGWHALILYPDEFVPEREVVDENGLVWIDDQPKTGEAWQQGPVILSLADAAAGRRRDGFNVVIHEMAHKLDMRDGSADGHPPLHRGMRDADWAAAFSAAYDDLCRRVDQDPDDPGLPLDPYASESPAELFAVATETFFELPHHLVDAYPQVYDQLVAFYRQDPGQRLRRDPAPGGRIARIQ
jgi:Mlc titration factor MtfA (ptsG expression regulator)